MPRLLGIVSLLLARVLAILVCVCTRITPADAGCGRVELRGRNPDLVVVGLARSRQSAAPTSPDRTLAGIDKTRRVALAR